MRYRQANHWRALVSYRLGASRKAAATVRGSDGPFFYPGTLGARWHASITYGGVIFTILKGRFFADALVGLRFSFDCIWDQFRCFQVTKSFPGQRSAWFTQR